MLLVIGTRACCFVLGLLLILFAAFQYNDPDPAVWMLIYGVGASVPLMAAADRYSQRLLWLCLGLCLAGFAMSFRGTVSYFVSHFHDVSIIHGMSPDKPYIEDTREFIGTAIVAAILLFSQVVKRYISRGSSSMHTYSLND